MGALNTSAERFCMTNPTGPLCKTGACLGQCLRRLHFFYGVLTSWDQLCTRSRYFFINVRTYFLRAHPTSVTFRVRFGYRYTLSNKQEQCCDVLAQRFRNPFDYNSGSNLLPTDGCFFAIKCSQFSFLYLSQKWFLKMLFKYFLNALRWTTKYATESTNTATGRKTGGVDVCNVTYTMSGTVLQC